MKAQMLLKFIIIYSLTISVAIACPEGLMPDNNLSFPRDKSLLNSHRESIVHKLKNRFERYYTSIVAEEGGKLKIEVDLDSDVVNAYAMRDKNKHWLVKIMGGLVRHNLMTEDALALVICHELGHHIGGAPRKIQKFGPGRDDYPTNEGQSDYFASMKCFRSLFAVDDNKAIVSKMVINQTAKEACIDIYGEESNENFLCQRISAASKKLATLLNKGRPVSFETKDPRIVLRTISRHPRGQCRLDTYFAGARCDNLMPTNNENEKQGMCNRSDGISIGVRPLCWFKPKVDLF